MCSLLSALHVTMASVVAVAVAVVVVVLCDTRVKVSGRTDVDKGNEAAVDRLQSKRNGEIERQNLYVEEILTDQSGACNKIQGADAGQ